MKSNVPKETFSRYQVFIIALLAFLQFTIILDFMVLSPLGVILLDTLHINTQQFGLVVSAYAFSAGLSGILAAGFADKFDRKKLLLFFYTGFLIGTLFCGLAPNYHLLLVARIVTGIFGGVIGSITMAIVTDLFSLSMRGRVMGFVQMAFAASQILGIPIGLYLANHYGWHSPFMLIVGVSLVVGVFIVLYMKPVNEHLKIKSDTSAFRHLTQTISKPVYIKGFLATVFLATGGFMLMPFASAFSTHNLGISLEQLPMLYLITGIFSMIFGPITGKLSDTFGKYKMFVIGSVLASAMILIYTQLSITPLWLVILLNVILFIGISSRMISAQALMSAVPDQQDRGAFMSITSSVQQISGGVAAYVAGLIVLQRPDGFLERYPVVGYVVVGSVLVTVVLMYLINQYVAKKGPNQHNIAPSAVAKTTDVEELV
ncbi:MAG: MFS transporter [Bacteroidetes bacterium]|nr:MFS transporter [Bacteroidota bacterium]